MYIYNSLLEQDLGKIINIPANVHSCVLTTLQCTHGEEVRIVSGSVCVYGRGKRRGNIHTPLYLHTSVQPVHGAMVWDRGPHTTSLTTHNLLVRWSRQAGTNKNRVFTIDISIRYVKLGPLQDWWSCKYWQLSKGVQPLFLIYPRLALQRTASHLYLLALPLL